MKFICSILLFGVLFVANLQGQELKNYDFIYKDNIRTVRFHVNGLPVSMPIIDLGRSAKLLLTFDDMEADDKTYTYTITHHNADWSRSDLQEMDFVESFASADIEDYDFAFNTKANFTHYALMLPNEDVIFTVSGNYLVTVYNSDTGEAVLSRRFVVVEPLVVINQEYQLSPADKQDTHQAVSFIAEHQSLNVQRPMVELTANIVQNGRWDNAFMTVKPRFSEGSTTSFNEANEVLFEAGQEFRYVDIRSLDNLKLGTKDIQEGANGYTVILDKENKRAFKGFSSYRDINGDFVIENEDGSSFSSGGFLNNLFKNQSSNNNTTLTNYRVNSAEDYLDGFGQNVLSSDYANVVFSLMSPTEYYDDDVYLFGKMSDWQIKPEFKMTYNDKYNAYIGEALLKQGFYNYYFVTTPKAGGKPSQLQTEGNWFETENEYTILLYYRSFGARYDRVVAAYTFDSATGMR